MTEKISMRKAYGTTLAELGAKHKNLVVLDADLSCSTNTEIFAQKFPERFFNMGIAEQDMAATAAGLATCGKTPFFSTFAIFATGRCYDQIRNSIASPKLDVNIVATHGGMTVGPDGASHQSLEDLGMMRGVPNMRVFIPADAKETSEIIKHLLTFKGPSYTRVSRMSVENIYPDNHVFKEKADVLKDGSDLSIIACGLLVKEALEAAELLKKDKVSAEVVNMHTLKPIDSAQIIKSAKNCGRIITAEEHSINNGLGSAVAEVLSENCPVPLQRIGVRDVFGQSGSPWELMKEYGLTANNIYDRAKKLVR